MGISSEVLRFLSDCSYAAVLGDTHGYTRSVEEFGFLSVVSDGTYSSSAYYDFLFIDTEGISEDLVEVIRRVCNSCAVLAGSRFEDTRVSGVIAQLYGQPDHVCEDGSWIILNPRRKLCVVIPIYKRKLDEDERDSLKQCLLILGKRHDVKYIAPESLDTENYGDIPETAIVRFPDTAFASRHAYNKLCLSTDLYTPFSDYSHILIYQLDGYVYRDDLFERWMRYDYVGAPFCFRCKRCNPCGVESRVGNGGVSLRNVKSFLAAVASVGPNAYDSAEDSFIAACTTLRKPDCHEALHFSMESQAYRGYRETREVPSFSHKLSYYGHPDLFSFFKCASRLGFPYFSAANFQLVTAVFGAYGSDKRIDQVERIRLYARQLMRLSRMTDRRPCIVETNTRSCATVRAVLEFIPNGVTYAVVPRSFYVGAVESIKLVVGSVRTESTWDAIPKNVDLIIDNWDSDVKDILTHIQHLTAHLADDGVIIIDRVDAGEVVEKLCAVLPGSAVIYTRNRISGGNAIAVLYDRGQLLTPVS